MPHVQSLKVVGSMWCGRADPALTCTGGSHQSPMVNQKRGGVTPSAAHFGSGPICLRSKPMVSWILTRECKARFTTAWTSMDGVQPVRRRPVSIRRARGIALSTLPLTILMQTALHADADSPPSPRPTHRRAQNTWCFIIDARSRRWNIAP